VRALLLALLLLAAPVAAPVWAVQPDEVLADPALETRARKLSAGLRCLVCRTESIDESNAPLARDLRLLVRERLVAGDTDPETIAYIVDRFGEYVLLNPTTSGSNIILWLAAPGLLLAGLGISALYLRRRAQPAGVEALSSDERARLDQILKP